jgi:hypothetical protein
VATSFQEFSTSVFTTITPVFTAIMWDWMQENSHCDATPAGAPWRFSPGRIRSIMGFVLNTT